MADRLHRWSLPIAVAVLAVLLFALAYLQHRWTGELSEAEAARLREVLAAAAADFSLDVDREVTRAFLHFQVPSWSAPAPDGYWAERLAAWRLEAPYPDLLAAVERIDVRSDAVVRIDPANGRFEPVPWPVELEPFRRRLRAFPRWPSRERHGDDGEARSSDQGSDARPSGGTWGVDGEAPAVLLPVYLGDEENGKPGRWRFPGGMLVLRFDRQYLRDELLPELVARRFSSARDVVLRVEDAAGRVLFRSSPPGAAPPRPGAPDLETRLFTFLPPEELRPAWVEATLPPSLTRAAGGGDGPRRRPWTPTLAFLDMQHEGEWRLAVFHSAGSLAEVVERARRRNLLLGSAALLLLGLTAGTLALAARRAFAVAREREQLVATASHELRTPLAAVRSLGENLADGVVAEPERVRHYGETIVREGEHLTSMVEQMLELGVSRSGTPRESRTVDLEELAAAAVEDLAGLASERGVRIERTARGPGVAVRGDPAALRRAIDNLLVNALTHGGGGGWVGVGVAEERARGGRWARLDVEDRGPGVARADLRRVFEPFYRGAGGQGRGGGLGLALVREIARAHGGRVELASQPDRGARFTLVLPAAAPPSEAAEEEER